MISCYHLYRCADSDKAQVVRVTASNLCKLSTQLTKVAHAQAEGVGGAEAEQRNAEDSEILRRDWSSQVSSACSHTIARIRIYSS